jgi:hypothetical protein
MVYRMAAVDLVDETYVVVERGIIAAVIADPQRWQTWWPGLTLTVFMDRAQEGLRWTVTGELVGTSEVWLESVANGVIVHYYLRADPTTPGSAVIARRLPDSHRGRREIDRIRRRHALAWKRTVWALKDELEGERSLRAPGDR